MINEIFTFLDQVETRNCWSWADQLTIFLGLPEKLGRRPSQDSRLSQL